MDIEALKEQWSEIEDRDGLRLSWNVFPSSRMVCGTIWSFKEILKSCRKLHGS
jgi:hypothetical protein